MEISMSRLALSWFVVGTIALAGCRTANDEVETTVEADTSAAVQPRSPAEIEQESRPMTPERAEELGVIDTTIQVTDEP
jgi:hypothetical protein